MEQKKSYTYDYPMPAMTTDSIVVRDGKEFGKYEILLIKRKNEPFKDKWAFPGGFMEIDETLEECAVRELKEETSLDALENDDITNLGSIGYADTIDRDPRGRTLSVQFFFLVNDRDIEAKAADDAKELKWFPLDELPEMAFDHKDIIDKHMYHIVYNLNTRFI